MPCQSVGVRLGWQRDAIGIRIVNGFGEHILGERQQGDLLLRLNRGRRLSGVSNAHRFQNVAEDIDFQHRIMGDPWIVRIAFMVVINGFAWVGKKDCVAVR